MKYIFMVLALGLMVITSVWQNIEVMKLKMEYRRLVQHEKDLIRKNDILRYKISRITRMEIMEKQAEQKGYRQLKPGDVHFLLINNKKREGK